MATDERIAKYEDKMNKTMDTSQREFIEVYSPGAGINVCFHAI